MQALRPTLHDQDTSVMNPNSEDMDMGVLANTAEGKAEEENAKHPGEPVTSEVTRWAPPFGRVSWPKSVPSSTTWPPMSANQERWSCKCWRARRWVTAAKISPTTWTSWSLTSPFSNRQKAANPIDQGLSFQSHQWSRLENPPTLWNRPSIMPVILLSSSLMPSHWLLKVTPAYNLCLSIVLGLPVSFNPMKSYQCHVGCIKRLKCMAAVIIQTPFRLATH